MLRCGFRVSGMALSIYQLKPRFQALLRPTVVRLVRLGVTANQVTLSACLVSVAIGLGLYLSDAAWAWFALIPVWMLLRMAFNAVDGMLAREHRQQSVLGAYLNELTDVLSDAALYLPFARVAPFDPFWLGVVVLAAALSEMAGVLGGTVGGARQYDGPMGKSDRAFVFGLLGGLVALFGQGAGLPGHWWPVAWVLPLVVVLTSCAIYNRIQSGIQHSHERRS